MRGLVRDIWKIVERYPFLLFWPVTLYMRFFERERLNQMIEEATGR